MILTIMHMALSIIGVIIFWNVNTVWAQIMLMTVIGILTVAIVDIELQKLAQKHRVKDNEGEKED